MNRTALPLLLFVVLSFSQNPPDFVLSPAIPPVAFVGQYYTCDFRVTGLTNPQYTFMNLPRFFKSSPSGRIEGIPSEKGTFTITVNYQQNRISSQKSVVLRITDSSSTNQEQTKSVSFSQNLNNVAVIPSLFSQGEPILINLSTYVSGKKTWIYDRLPIDLQGTTEGQIRGRISTKGMYTFGAVCSDNQGVSSNYILTLNIQPSYYNPYDYLAFSSSDYQPSTQIVDVPIRNTCQCQGIIVEDLQRTAVLAVTKAKQDVKALEVKVSNLKNQVLKISSEAALAEKTLAMATVLRDRLLAEQTKAMMKSKDAKDIFTKVNNTYELYVTNYNQHLTAVKSAEYYAQCAEQLLQTKRQLLDQANAVFIKAQNDSAAACAEIEKIMLKITSGKEDVTAMFDLVKVAKQNLLKAQGTFSSQDMDIENLKTERDIANMQNDIAIAQLRTRDSILNKATEDLKKANNNLFDLRVSKDEAGKQLGIAKFNLNQAMNNLLVAQAAKEQADKALALASAEASTMPEGNSTYVFSGCDIGAYPTYAGSARLVKLQKDRAVLQNGKVILYGACTKTEPLQEGDLIHFSGYFKGGSIQAVVLNK